ncbi:hypothetical protein B0O99DRAFT_656961 [Bisporella sp. PMI_857]|nr:hypothetical protein B0O99DRAFT_656961 [Bisporella sp. PMI_857]
MSSREGFRYTSSGLTTGLPCKGVISPSISLRLPQTATYDVIVLGAGYAGLIAARDLATSGKTVLLIEARDRIGGRAWTSEIDGYPYELGGTWIHWNQPHVYREISRYGLQNQIEQSQDYSRGFNYCSLNINNVSKKIDHTAEEILFGKGVQIFCDVDGQLGKTVIPFPHNPLFTASARRYDQLSVGQRLREIESRLSNEEMLCLEAFLLHSGGGTLENMGFLDILRWWALCGYKTDGISEFGLSFKLKCGQTDLELKIFEEAKGCESLSYAFDSLVDAVDDNGRLVKVQTRNGLIFQAKRVICTIPLNVLHSVAFSPQLPTAKVEASTKGHVDKATKVHVEANGPDLRSWSGVAYPNQLLFAYGDGMTPSGNTHIVCFGADLDVSFQPEDIEKTIGAVQRFHPMDIKQMVFHNWAKDEFANGSWCMFRPGFSVKYLDALRARHGNVHFASSDWALGWRGFIDGAIEDGARAAYLVRAELNAAVLLQYFLSAFELLGQFPRTGDYSWLFVNKCRMLD